MQTDMWNVYVRSLPSADTINIRFSFLPESETNKPAKMFQFNRRRNELLSVTVSRIIYSINDRFAKKKRYKKSTEKIAVFDEVGIKKVRLLDASSTELDQNSVTVESGFLDGHILCLDEIQFVIKLNPPGILKCEFTGNAMVDFPVYPLIEYEFCELKSCRFTWSLHPPLESKPQESTKKWKPVGDGYSFTPIAIHLGYWMKLEVTPRCSDNGVEGSTVVTVIDHPISAGPQQTAIKKRLTHTTKRTSPGEIRFVSYNLLANVYTDSDFSRNELFNYCPNQFLCMGYRQNLLLRELVNYNADIICLQEVDKYLYCNLLVPALKLEGFASIFQPKLNCSEGVAIFYRHERFDILENQSLDSLTKAFYTLKGLEDLQQAVVTCSELHKRWGERTTCLAACLLKDNTTEPSSPPFLVTNTHLYFKPDADHIRLLQARVLIDHMKEVSDGLPERPTLLIAGDWNSNPNLGVFQLITCGHLPSDHVDWTSSGDTEFCSPPDMSHSLDSLKSAYTQVPFTNYTPNYHAAIDHIFYDSAGLDLLKVVPLPSLEEVTEKIALPNEDFPSDHLALVADFKIKI